MNRRKLIGGAAGLLALIGIQLPVDATPMKANSRRYGLKMQSPEGDILKLQVRQYSDQTLWQALDANDRVLWERRDRWWDKDEVLYRCGTWGRACWTSQLETHGRYSELDFSFLFDMIWSTPRTHLLTGRMPTGGHGYVLAMVHRDHVQYFVTHGRGVLTPYTSDNRIQRTLQHLARESGLIPGSWR